MRFSEGLGRIVLSAALALVPLASFAQGKPEFVYNVDFEYYFDNREFDAGGQEFTPSMTVNAARLTPMAGIGIRQDRFLTHKVMAGIDVVKNMGESVTPVSDPHLDNLGLFRELFFWYNLDARLRKADINGYAGMFPRRFSVFGGIDTPSSRLPGHDIPTLFLSEENRFYDTNMEGILITAQRPRSYYEIGLDWLGMFGPARREQFIISTYGKSQLNRWLQVGWVGTFHHYANSAECRGVVDNHLLSPFVSFDFGRVFHAGIQDLSLTLNGILGVHQDRMKETGLQMTRGAQVTTNVRNWNVGIRNEFYLGSGQMPYFDHVAPEGVPYGTSLYRGNPFYRMQGGKDEWEHGGVYDRLELYYQPKIAYFMDLRLSFVAHFNDCTMPVYQGWQQKFSILIDLDRLKQKPERQANTKSRERSIFDLFL
ncbi:MAG: hypothetical protein MJY86_01555 [Bacteroidales bacterium]|nr:hypothetical protein [Bacteroidales bacterium]